MDILNYDVDKMIQNKANDIYQKVCIELIEKNGLAEKALSICNEICEIHIADEKGKDPLLSYEKTWKDIQREISKRRK